MLEGSGGFGKKRASTVGQVLSHSTKLNSALQKELNNKDTKPFALQVFKNITGYMGDRKSSKDAYGHITKLLRTGRFDHVPRFC
jgi:hypothetical protein